MQNTTMAKDSRLRWGVFGHLEDVSGRFISKSARTGILV